MFDLNKGKGEDHWIVDNRCKEEINFVLGGENRVYYSVEFVSVKEMLIQRLTIITCGAKIFTRYRQYKDK